MKDFVKWLGVNEKIAKIVVWLLIIMGSLVIINTAFESIGIPNYKITYENLKSIKVIDAIDYFIVYLISIMMFYSMTLLVFRTKDIPKMFKYSILYLITNIILSFFIPYNIMQIIIIIFVICFCYFYSGKKWKYAIYGLLGYALSIFVQGIWYMSKVKFIDYTKLSDTTKSILSLDYFIIMAIIILVKEIYLKKRSEMECSEDMENQHAFCGSVTSKKKEH